ncbi:MAG: nucleotide exchange factor GrpE [Chloroflexaceae bacterium]|nr:nucleotide exchange factor GrpE [Chloroflexaceae bacterium]
MIAYIRWLLSGNRRSQRDRASTSKNRPSPAGAGGGTGVERAVTVHLTVADREALFDPLIQRLDALDQRLVRLEAVDERLSALAQVQTTLQQGQGETALAVQTLRESLEAVQKSVSRSGKEQFKANSLTEKNLEQLSETLRLLRAADERRESEVLAQHDQSRKAQAAARQEVVRSLLPVLDSLDEAIRSGRQVLKRLEPARAIPPETVMPSSPSDLAPAPVSEAVEPPPSGRSFLERLFGRRSGELPDQAREREGEQDEAPAGLTRTSTSPHGANGSTEPSTDLRQAMEAWVEGLTFVVQRLLNILAAEEVYPIEAEGQPFDPQLHMAIDTVPASGEVADGVVAAELRRGYLLAGRVLRHAEVIVARAPRLQDTNQVSVTGDG